MRQSIIDRFAVVTDTGSSSYPFLIKDLHELDTFIEAFRTFEEARLECITLNQKEALHASTQ